MRQSSRHKICDSGRRHASARCCDHREAHLLSEPVPTASRRIITKLSKASRADEPARTPHHTFGTLALVDSILGKAVGDALNAPVAPAFGGSCHGGATRAQIGTTGFESESVGTDESQGEPEKPVL